MGLFSYSSGMSVMEFLLQRLLDDFSQSKNSFLCEMFDGDYESWSSQGMSIFGS